MTFRPPLEDLRAQTGPHQLIDTRVVVPVPAAGDALAAAKMPRPRKFDENDSLADYLVEESSRFTSSVQPGGNQVAHKAGYVYHSRFNIEYWPHSGQRSTDEANMPTHRQRETLETHREKPVYTNEFVDTSVPPQTLKTQPEFTVPEFTDMGQAQHSAATTVPNNITSSAEQIVEVHRNVPVPVEAIITQELVLPKVRVNKTRVDYPVRKRCFDDLLPSGGLAGRSVHRGLLTSALESLHGSCLYPPRVSASPV